MTNDKPTLLQIDRAIGNSLFMVKVFHFFAGVILGAAILFLAQGITLVSVFAALFLIIIGAGGNMVMAEVALDRANKGKIILAARVAAQQYQRSHGALLGAVYPVEEETEID